MARAEEKTWRFKVTFMGTSPGRNSVTNPFGLRATRPDPSPDRSRFEDSKRLFQRIRTTRRRGAPQGQAMPHVVIVGDRESGKATFLSLLYATQVKSGSDASDAFRFHADVDSLDEISEAFEQLMSGSFPDSATKEGMRGITFHLGYRKAGRGVLSRLRSRGWDAGGSIALHFILVRNVEEEMSRFRRGSSLTNADLREVLESDAIAILVDSTKLGPRTEDRTVGPMDRYDTAVESLLSAVRRSRPRGSRRPIHPIVVFSKFDSVDPKALLTANLAGAPPHVKKTGPRSAYAEALLEASLPRTKIRLRRTNGAGWEPDYSADEYRALLERLWTIASNAGE